MSKTIVIVGFGPGISTAVAERFGAEGFAVALVARNQERLTAGAAALKAKGISAAPIVADAADPASVCAAIGKARDALGPVTAILWNAFDNTVGGDLLTTDPAALGPVINVAVVGLLAAVQTALPDLKSAGDGAVLVTNGAFGEDSPMMDGLAVHLNAMGMLSQKLKPDGVYVGQVMVAGGVKSTPTGEGATIESADVAAAFWALYKTRDEVHARIM
jgi:NADP-dependent 3-hydroxy acid dehydrogenase YdfG